MELEDIKSQVSERLPGHRFQHVLRVTDTARKLAAHYGIDERAVELAALLHDVAKYDSEESLRGVIEREKLDKRLLGYHKELWHGPVGSVIAKEEFGITDAGVLLAIRYHTTGRANMTAIEKILYVADMLEPEREFPGVAELRAIMYDDLDEVMKQCIKHSISWLLHKQVPVYPDSFECYNDLVMRKET